MNTRFERCENYTNEWYTPPEIIKKLTGGENLILILVLR